MARDQVRAPLRLTASGFRNLAEFDKASFLPIRINLPAASAGRNLIAAKADVGHGEWLPMLKEIGINDQVARQLMSIGGNPALSNPSNCLDLPTAARALYELSRLDPEVIEEGIANGDVTPAYTCGVCVLLGPGKSDNLVGFRALLPRLPHRPCVCVYALPVCGCSLLLASCLLRLPRCSACVRGGVQRSVCAAALWCVAARLSGCLGTR